MVLIGKFYTIKWHGKVVYHFTPKPKMKIYLTIFTSFFFFFLREGYNFIDFQTGLKEIDLM